MSGDTVNKLDAEDAPIAIIKEATYAVDGDVVDHASNSSTTFKTNLDQSNDDFYNDEQIKFTTGNNTGQVRRISDYDGTSKFITVPVAFQEEPAEEDEFQIIPLVAGAATGAGDATEAKQDTIITNLATIDGYHDVPTQNVATNTQIRDVVGNKTDTVAGTSVVALAKQILDDTDLIDDATDGLAAIKAEVEGIGGITPATQANVSTEVDEQIGNYAGQTNLQTLLAALGIPDVSAKPLYTCLITDRLDNATYGLSAIETLVDDLETRLTAARAGYLDELDFGLAEYLEDLRQKATGPSWDQDTDSLEAIRDAVDGVPTTTEAEGYVENAADTGTTHDITTANDKTETQVFEVAKSGIYALSVYFDLDVLETAVEGGTVTIKLYNKIDGTNYSDTPSAYIEYVVGTEDEYPSIELNMIHEYTKVTIQCSDDVTATRSIAYRYITRDLGV